MSNQTAKSFDEVAFLEAIARRSRVDLVLKPIRPGAPTRLRSRFLGGDGETERLIIDVPDHGGRKVFLPVGWDLGLSFRVGKLAMQARTTVVDHCLFPLFPTQRADGVAVERPDRILTVEERQEPRVEVDPTTNLILASLWPADRLAAGEQPAPWVGRVSNRSDAGLGIAFCAPLPPELAPEVILRLEEPDSDEHRLYRAMRRHCTVMADGQWLAGFADVTELGPGEAITLVEALAGPFH